MLQDKGRTSWIFGDAHVHLHDSFDFDLLFNSAYNRFQQTAISLNIHKKIYCFLLLTESRGNNMFSRLRDAPEIINTFSIKKTAETNTLWLSNSDTATMFLVAGKQIVTQESLEVLAIGLDTPYPDGQPLVHVMNMLKKRNLPMILPWGAGKWFGRRGRIIKNTIDNFHSSLFFLGDNSNRPFFWPKSPLFRQAELKSIFNLQGSDPLPFPGQEKKVGNFGFYLPGTVNPEMPFQSLIKLLSTVNRQPGSFGKLEKTFPFFHHQLSMQLSSLFHI